MTLLFVEKFQGLSTAVMLGEPSEQLHWVFVPLEIRELVLKRCPHSNMVLYGTDE